MDVVVLDLARSAQLGTVVTQSNSIVSKNNDSSTKTLSFDIDALGVAEGSLYALLINAVKINS